MHALSLRKDYATKSMEMTHRWLVRCKNQFENTEPKYGYKQFLFPIVQAALTKIYVPNRPNSLLRKT